MNITETKLKDVFIIEPKIFQDERGKLIKIFHKETFAGNGMNCEFKESFYSISHKNVIRGMHFQVPPKEHVKLIYVTSGAILDVVLDIRKNSPTYGQYITEELSSANNKMIYIPAGCAHGFLSLEDSSCVVYLQSSMHSPEHDAGIHHNSFGMKWDAEKPIVSQRDQKFLPLEKFDSPFIYK